MKAEAYPFIATASSLLRNLIEMGPLTRPSDTLSHKGEGIGRCHCEAKPRGEGKTDGAEWNSAPSDIISVKSSRGSRRTLLTYAYRRMGGLTIIGGVVTCVARVVEGVNKHIRVPEVSS